MEGESFPRLDGGWCEPGTPRCNVTFGGQHPAAGEYYAIALDYIEPGAGSDPEFLERIRNRASTFAAQRRPGDVARFEAREWFVDGPFGIVQERVDISRRAVAITTSFGLRTHRWLIVGAGIGCVRKQALAVQ